MLIQPRDVKLLASIHVHRFQTSEHLHHLFFRGRSLRAAQARLKELLDASFIERTYLMPPVDGGRPRLRPLYSLARAGANVVADLLRVPVAAVAHTTAAKRIGYEHLLHELVVTDFLVSADVVLDGTGCNVVVLRDHALRSALSRYRAHPAGHRAVVPDAAITITGGALPSPTTFYLEVVHAGVKGGNTRLVEKLDHYVGLNRGGYFANVFGHRRVRGVVVVSPSADRVENLRALAARRMRQGHRFVWFAAAPRHLSRTHPPTTFTPETLATTDFVDVAGDHHRFGLDAFH